MRTAMRSVEMWQKVRRATVLALLAGVCFAPLPVMAQSDPDAEPNGTAAGSEDRLVVTATGREESVSHVPYNITAVDGDEVERAQVLDETELLRSVPGVTPIDRGPRNAGTLNSVRMRGLSVEGGALGDYAVSATASVSTYVDSTPVYAGFLLTDLERVEVLRGPQGTLYGSGSLGGTIRYITRDPELGEYGGYMAGAISQVEGSEGIGYGGDAVVNVPLGETLALRVVGTWIDYPGITDYVNVYRLDGNGYPTAPSGVLSSDAEYREVEDADTVDVWMGRATLLWEATPDLSFRLMHTRQSDEIGGRRQRTVGFDGFGRRYDDYENGSIQLEPSSRDINLTALEAEVDFGFATLTSSSAYYDHSGESISENTGFYAQSGLLGAITFYPRPMASAVRSYADEAFSQELRLVSEPGDRFDYVVGGFFRAQQTEATQDSYLRGFKQWWDAAFPGFTGDVTGDQDFRYRRREDFTELAAYGELTWHVTDNFDLIGGARVFDHEAENWTLLDFPLYTGLFVPSVSRFDTTDDGALFKVGAAWWVTERDMVYATISEGYRRGGANAVPTSGFYAEDPRWQIYDADEVMNYEIGVKGDHGSFVFDVSAFYIDWQDPQLNTSTTNWGFFAVQNGGAARSYGVEGLVEGWFGDGFHYALGYAYVNAELTENFYQPDFPPPAAPIALDGAMLPGTPEHQLTWALDHTGAIGGVGTFVRIDGYYQSETQNGVGISPVFNVPLDGFAIWNATGTLSFGDVDVSLWAKNVFNEDGVTGVYTEAYMGTAPGVGYYGNGSKELIALPRTLGFSVRYDF